ncbi:DUF1302 domain-containing protein [Solimicrobium silvestre]|uniref:DUF1302 domain-containing protein n=1 Tax=Solimicrobium silvestre TaxID=2099400 RepID=A0A2S9GW82_9BURK|nr:DUF1302 family protein [Solimicrobium silvestre]PRC91985.1 hypothetical protein S2091_3327 [Solimicrobium silvestre]
MKKSILKLVGVTVCGAVTYLPVHAENYDTGIGDLQAAWVSNITGGIGMRTKSPSCTLTGDPNANGCGASANVAGWANGDNGDLNYKKDQLYTAYSSLTSELYLTSREQGFKFLMRATGLYDFAADDTQRTPLSTDAKAQSVHSIVLLDLWAQKDFQLADQSAHVRLGNQVINWGESQYALGGINATNSLDLQKLDLPGTLLKQALLPAPMLSFVSSLPGGWSTEAYVQWGWNGDKFPPVGTFWSTSNGLGRGAVPFTSNTTNYNLGGLNAGSIAGANSNNSQYYDSVNQNLVNGQYSGAPYNSIGYQPITNNPGNNTQGGVKLAYKPSGSDVSYAFYYENYTDKMPNATYLASGATEYSYVKDRSLFGVSANFQSGQWAFGTELSYRPHDAVSMTGCFIQGGPADYNTNALAGANCQGWKDFSKYEFIFDAQWQQTRGDPFLSLVNADTGIFSAELAVIDYPDVNANTQYTRTVAGQKIYQLVDAGYGASLVNNQALGYQIYQGVGTSVSSGLVLDYNVTYDNSVIKGWQVTTGLTFYDSFKGVTPTLYENYAHGYKSANFYMLFNQNPAVWQAGLNYTAFFGGNSTTNAYSDRNNIGVFVTRNF